MNRLCTIVLTSALVASAHASITGVSGQTTWLGSSPLSAQAFSLTGPTVYAWDEQFGVVGPTAINTAGNGTFTGFSPYSVGFLSGGFASHMLHFDPAGNPPFASGSVTFSQPIVALIFDEAMLSASDSVMGSPGTTYDTGSIFRSFNGSVLGGTSLTVAGNALSFQFTLTPGQINRMYEVRVITVVPTPATASLIGLGGLLATRRRRR